MQGDPKALEAVVTVACEFCLVSLCLWLHLSPFRKMSMQNSDCQKPTYLGARIRGCRGPSCRASTASPSRKDRESPPRRSQTTPDKVWAADDSEQGNELLPPVLHWWSRSSRCSREQSRLGPRCRPHGSGAGSVKSRIANSHHFECLGTQSLASSRPALCRHCCLLSSFGRVRWR